MFFSSKKYSRYIYKKKLLLCQCAHSYVCMLRAFLIWPTASDAWGLLLLLMAFMWPFLLCGHTITGLVQCCQHHLIGYYTSSLEKSHSLLFYQRILMMAIMVKSFEDISIHIKTFKFFLAEFIIFFLQFGFKGIIVLSGN